MSGDIHQIGDFPEQRNHRENGAGYFSYYDHINQHESGAQTRKESFCKMIKIVCCPSLKFVSFIFIMALIDVATHIVLISFGIDTSPDTYPITFLGPTDSTLKYLIKISYVILNWRRNNSQNNMCMLFLLIFMLLMLLLSGVANPKIDYFGHLGGAIFGFLAGFGLSRTEEPVNNKLLRTLTLCGCGALILMFVTLMYTYPFTCSTPLSI